MKVKISEDNLLEFDNGLVVEGVGDKDCCAYNYLDFEQLPVGTELPTMTAPEFAANIRLMDDGFSVKDSQGTPKWVQARSSQNGYYSSSTDLVLKYEGTQISLGRLDGDVSE